MGEGSGRSLEMPGSVPGSCPGQPRLHRLDQRGLGRAQPNPTMPSALPILQAAGRCRRRHHRIRSCTMNKPYGKILIFFFFSKRTMSKSEEAERGNLHEKGH